MITLYQFATSPFAEKVRRALSYKKIAYTIQEVDRVAVPSGKYARVSPTGKFPAIDHDGKAIWDSTDILHYLDQNWPEFPLIPQNPRSAALVHVFEDWADESLYFYEIMLRLAWEHNLEAALPEFAPSMSHVPRSELKNTILAAARTLTQAQGLGRKPREQIIEDVRRHFTALDRLLDGGEWLVGSTISVADLAVVVQVNALLYAAEAREALAQSQNILAWIARLNKIAPHRSEK